MSVQIVWDNGLLEGSIDLKDHVTVRSMGQSQVITIEAYLAANSQYDASESPNERLAHVLQQADRLIMISNITNFVNSQTGLWDRNHPTAVAANGDSQATQCSEGTTFVAARGLVTDNFCIDRVATETVANQYPTWWETKGFCEAAGKFLLTYEQHKLGAESTDTKVVWSSGNSEWVLKSNGDDDQGQVGIFFHNDNLRYFNDDHFSHYNPVRRLKNIAFRCGVFPS